MKMRAMHAVKCILEVLIDLTRAGGSTLYELAERHGVTPRTMRKYFAVLDEIGVPLEEEPGEGAAKRWRIAFNTPLQKLSGLFDVSHYLAVLVAVGQSALLRKTALFTAVEDLTGRMEKAFGAKGRARLAQILGCFFWNEKQMFRIEAPDILWPLIDAMIDKRICTIMHRSPKPLAVAAPITGLPLKIYFYDGAMYLAIWDIAANKIKTPCLQRARGLVVTDRRMETPKEFDAEKLGKSGFGMFSSGPQTDFHCRTTREIAEFIAERIWVLDEEQIALEGGGLDHKFRVADSHEVLAHVLRWTEGIEVLGPISMRQRLYQFGLWLVKTYGPKAGEETRVADMKEPQA